MPEASKRTTEVASHPVMELFAVASRHLDLVTDDDVFQEGEMRITVRRVDGDAALAGVCRAFDMTWTESQCLPAAAREHDGAGMEPPHFDARDRPCICP